MLPETWITLNAAERADLLRHAQRDCIAHPNQSFEFPTLGRLFVCEPCQIWFNEPALWEFEDRPQMARFVWRASWGLIVLGFPPYGAVAFQRSLEVRRVWDVLSKELSAVLTVLCGGTVDPFDQEWRVSAMREACEPPKPAWVADLRWLGIWSVP